jgi:MinD-like ATPase involved in chromosome partitioning or flagellar assembly
MRDPARPAAYPATFPATTDEGGYPTSYRPGASHEPPRSQESPAAAGRNGTTRHRDRGGHRPSARASRSPIDIPLPSPLETDGTAGSLATGALVSPRPEVSDGGWRRFVHRMSGGVINPGPSPDEARHRRLVAHIRTPLMDCHRIAVLSLKGGVGKTTTTMGLGSTLASLRGDRAVAIDANPDRGTLGGKVPRQTQLSVRDLLDNADRLARYVDVRRFLSQGESRLEVLASARTPEISREFTEADYRRVEDILQRHYSIMLTDCGTGILHSAMPGVLALADTIVVVGSLAVDGGLTASATLDWLEAHGYAHLVRNAVTVVSALPTNGQSVDVAALEEHFAARTRRVITVPYDPALATGGHFDLDALRRPTRAAYLELAAAVAERFD